MSEPDREARGFSGLLELVSQVDAFCIEENTEKTSTPATESTAAVEPEAGGSARKTQQKADSASEKRAASAPEKSDGTVWKLIVGFAVLILIVWAYMKNSVSTPPERPAYSSGQSLSGSSSAGSGSTAGHVSEPDSSGSSVAESSAPVRDSSDDGFISGRPSTLVLQEPEYVIPPAGQGNILSVSQICWCVREKIRIESTRHVVETPLGVERFNQVVDDYNRRCGSFRYREGALTRARDMVEPHRNRIVERARREALSWDGEWRSRDSYGFSPSTDALHRLTQKEVIQLVQQVLKDLGYDPGTADGIMGRNTAEAIKKFQKDRNMTPTGKISTEVLNALTDAVVNDL